MHSDDDDKIIICSGKSASFALETALIPYANTNVTGAPAAAQRKIAEAKRLTDEAIAIIEKSIS